MLKALVPWLRASQLLPGPVINMGLHLPKGRLTAIFPASFGAYLLCTDTGNGRVNKTIDKDSRQVVHSFNVADMGSKVYYCRCWRSKKFPYCDGSHVRHNWKTGDNVGPLVIKK